MTPLRRVATLTAVACCVVLGAGTRAAAQPFAWVINPVFIVFGSGPSLRVVNLATGEHVWRLDLPVGIQASRGALTPDGRWYLLATSIGLARFDTATRELTGILGPSVSVAGLWVSPSGRAAHIIDANQRYYVIDPDTGVVLSERCCVDLRDQVFSPDGMRRYEVRSHVSNREVVVTARTNADNQVVWERTLAGVPLPRLLEATAQEIVIGIGDGGGRHVVVLNASDGSERGRITAGEVRGTACCHQGRVLVSTVTAALNSYREQLLAVDLATLQTTVLVERDGSLTTGFVGPDAPIFQSANGELAYWLRFSGIKPSISSTQYDSVDIASGRRLGTRPLVSRSVADFDVEPGIPCAIEPALTTIPAAAAGGSLVIPVTARGPCLPWRASTTYESVRLINPGPHSGSADLAAAFAPSPDGWTRLMIVSVAGVGVTVLQADERPAAPTAAVRLDNGRAVVTWLPSPGAMPTAFTVRGGVSGHSLQPLATVPADARTWISPPLAAGSYSLEVLAVNRGGEGPPGNRLAFTVDDANRPQPPANLTAETRDDAVILEWSAPPSGPTPTRYAIEARSDGASAFTGVAESSTTSFRAVDVPAGTWHVRVRAAGPGGISEPSASASIVAAACAGPPAPPRELTATSINRAVILQWRRPQAGSASDYLVEAGSAPGLSDIASLRTGGPGEHLEARVPPGLYVVRLRAVNGCGVSAPSPEAVVVVAP